MSDVVLAIVAHPDDESFWMGGTLARFAAEGKRVVVVAAADGLAGRTIDRSPQFERACDILGVAQQEQCHWFADQEADRVSQLFLNTMALMRVQRYRPSLVLTHYHSDLNLDHRRVSEAVLVATREVCPVWLCAPEFPDRCVGPRPVASRLVLGCDATKWAACACYPEEIAARPLTRSRQALALQGESFVVLP